ncbi:MAG: cache domain-containing protein, partial [Salinivirgaceae bacterium]|nr:cache domain-containing protein [Salinivirgaceae bacterium]
MKIRMSINAKMLIYILSTSIIIFAFSVGFISYRTRQLALSDAEKLAMKVAAQNALEVEKDLSNKLSVLRTFAQAFKVYDEMEEQEWKDLFVKMYYKVYEYNPDFYKLWDSWELNQFDPTWTKDHGRYAVTVFKQNGMIKSSASLRSVDGENERYLRIKALSCDMLWEPYWDEFLEETETKKFMTSISSPIYRNGQFAGIVAADILMDKFQKIVADIEPYKNTVAFLVSNQGVFVGHDN